MITDNCCFYLQNRVIQTSQTGGQQYSDTSTLVFPAITIRHNHLSLIFADNSKNVTIEWTALRGSCQVSLGLTLKYLI
jgi:hypothetical protein